jgi:hypothetical protein
MHNQEGRVEHGSECQRKRVCAPFSTSWLLTAKIPQRREEVKQSNSVIHAYQVPQLEFQVFSWRISLLEVKTRSLIWRKYRLKATLTMASIWLLSITGSEFSKDIFSYKFSLQFWSVGDASLLQLWQSSWKSPWWCVWLCVTFKSFINTRFYAGFSIFTNTRLTSQQWKKAAYGEPLFKETVSRLNSVKHKEELRKQLLHLLSDTTQWVYFK